MELAPSAADLALMALAAGIIGYSKTALGGLAVIAVGVLVYGGALLALGGIRQADLALVPGISPATINRLRRLKLLREG